VIYKLRVTTSFPICEDTALTDISVPNAPDPPYVNPIHTPPKPSPPHFGPPPSGGGSANSSPDSVVVVADAKVSKTAAALHGRIPIPPPLHPVDPPTVLPPAPAEPTDGSAITDSNGTSSSSDPPVSGGGGTNPAQETGIHVVVDPTQNVTYIGTRKSQVVSGGIMLLVSALSAGVSTVHKRNYLARHVRHYSVSITVFVDVAYCYWLMFC